MSLARWLLHVSVPKTLAKNISHFVWHKSFIKTVKYSFPCKRIAYRSFFGALLTFCYFHFYFSPRKVVCFSSSHLLEARFLASKNVVFRLFTPWRWDCWSVYPQFGLTKNSKFLIRRQNYFPFNNIQSNMNYINIIYIYELLHELFHIYFTIFSQL